MKKRINKIFSLLLTVAMVIGMLPSMAVAAEIPIPVTTEGNTYSLFTEENLENQYGTTFLYVIKKDGKYYTPAHPGSIGNSISKDSVAAVDITAYWDEDTNTFTGIPDSANVGVMQYQGYVSILGGDTALFLDGNIMFKLWTPFEDNNEPWFDGGIQYYDRADTYSYSRALWQATDDGSGYLYDIDWDDDSDAWIYGVLDLNSNNRFALRNKSAEYNEARNADPDNYDVSVNMTAYLYAAPCGHASLEHFARVAPTCMDKGCKEYWYCVYCGTYFKEAACTNAYDCKPVLPALDHNYGETECSRCGKDVPAYTKITSYEQFKTIDAPDASFIAVAEIPDGEGGTDYYVMKQEISAPDADIDEDGKPDILLVDENGNGKADVLEIDANGDGVADAMAYDGIYSGEPDGVLDDEEIWEYLFALENDYTDGYIPGLHTIGAIPVTPAKDGTISVKNLGALEWIMERTISDDELDDRYYGDGATVKDYENDFRFRIPNFWIRPVVTISNNYYQQPYEQGDSKWWGVLFGKDAKELNDLFFTESYPADAAVLYTESFHSYNADGQLEHGLRFLVNGEEKNFVITSDSFWEELEGTQYPVYLYCSDPGDKEVHEHIFSNWTSVSEENHKRICTVKDCSEYELASHAAADDAERTPDAENYQLGHWVTCTDCGAQIHEYHTREEAGRYDPNYWRDTGDGIHHVVNCTKCLGPVEYAEHDWSDWYNGNKEIDGEWVRGHYRRCEDWPCEANEWQAECIYDEGVVTTAPTCLETGVMTYTCMADPACELDTKTYNEEIPALGHDWGEWAPKDGDATKEQRVCKRDASHIEERDAAAHVHSWSNWTPDGDENHKRVCSAEGCTVENNTQTEAHNWGDWVITTQPTCVAEGVRTATCASCNATKTMAIPAVAENHNFSGWESISDTQHSRSCQNNGCTATETEDHTMETSVIQIESCEVEGQERHYCDTCGYEALVTRPARGHNYGDWTVVTPATETTEGLERRICANDNNHVQEQAIPVLTHTHTIQTVAAKAADCMNPGNIACYQCSSCQRYFSDAEGTTELDEEDVIIAALGHDWSDWADTGENATADVHKRFCKRSCGVADEIGNHRWSGWTDDGDTNHKKTCSICSGTRTAEHQWDEGVVTPPADGALNTAGTKVYTCSDCGKTKSEQLAACTNHQWQWEKFPSETDYHSGTCAVCGMLNHGDHEWDDGEVVTPATQLDDGWKVYTCEICDQQKGETIPKLDVPVDTTPDNNAAGAVLEMESTALINNVLPPEEQTAVNNGTATVSIYLQVEDISNTVAPAEAAAASGAAAEKGAQIGMYLDIDLFKAVTASGSTVETQVTETNGKVTITIQVPDELINTDPNVTRVYSIVRVHDGWAEIIYGEYDPATKTLTFQTDKFSTYALAYADTSTPVYDPYIPAPATYPVITASATNGTVKVNYTNVVAGATVTITVEPKTGYTLETLNVLDQLGRQIPVTSAGGGKYNFRMPAGGVTVVPTFMEDNTMLNFFVDVKAGDYYYDAVLWAAINGITKGDTAVTFAPDKACTRGQMVTFLWRAVGCPEPTGTAKGFADVAPDSYYSKAVLWAVEQGITNGTGNGTTFSPDEVCTRAQMATFLMRLAGGKALGTGAGFTDVKADAYYAEAVRWAAEQGITNGTGDGTTFSPDATCTRGQMVTFLYRYFAN